MSSVNSASKSSAVSASILASLSAALGGQSQENSGLFSGLLSSTSVSQKNNNGKSNAQSDNQNTSSAGDNSNIGGGSQNRAKLVAVVKSLRNRVQKNAAGDNQKNNPPAVQNRAPDPKTPNVNAQANTRTSGQSNTNNAPPPAKENCANTGDTNVPAIAPVQNTAAPAENSVVADTSLPTAAGIAATNASVFAAVQSRSVFENAASTENTAPVATATGKTASSEDDDMTDDELMGLLAQIEQLAAQEMQKANASAPTAQPGNQNGVQQDANNNPASISDNSGQQGRIDLKALMAAIAEMKAATKANMENGGTAQPDAGAAADQTPDAMNAALQTAVQAQTTTQQKQSTPAHDKLMNADFINFFNANSSDNAQSPAVNPAALTALAAQTGDDAGFDANSGGQTGLGARNGAAAPTQNVTLPVTAGTNQASPYDFASQLSATRATKGGSTGLPTPVEQVIFQMSRNLLKDNSGIMTIQLRPAELGRIDLKLHITSDGKVQGTVTADNPGTLGLLLKDVRGLERALQEAGLRADPGSLQFNLRGDGQPGGGFSQSTSNNNGGSGRNNNENFVPDSVIGAIADPVERYYLTPGGVNLRV